VLQPEGGFLLPERCIVHHVWAAQALGAEVHARERVLDWAPSPTGEGVRVRAAPASGPPVTYEAARLIVAAGAWTAGLVRRLAGLAVPERQVLAWLQPTVPERFALGRFPVFNLLVEEGRYYGFPVFGVPGFKIGRYHHLGERADPDHVQREPTARDEAVLRTFAERYFPDGAGPTMALKTCLFTNSPDEHFVVDRHPQYPQVVVASPCSGHGFKFASVIGEILADLATGGQTDHDISLFRLARFKR
jgi:sarcosine oxidase